MSKEDVCAKYGVHAKTFDNWKKKVDEVENFEELCALMASKNAKPLTAEESAMIQWFRATTDPTKEAIMAKVYALWPHRLQYSRKTVCRWISRFIRRWKLQQKSVV